MRSATLTIGLADAYDSQRGSRVLGGGIEDIGFILFIAFLLFGPKKLPEIARVLGKGMGELRRARDELRFSLEEEIRNLELDKQHLMDRVVERTLDIDDYGIEESAESAASVEPVEPAPAYGHDSSVATPEEPRS
ncbi:MAG: Sec-independent protein translocase subunit TatA/TatB [Terriglobia bacterium]